MFLPERDVIYIFVVCEISCTLAEFAKAKGILKEGLLRPV